MFLIEAASKTSLEEEFGKFGFNTVDKVAFSSRAQAILQRISNFLQLGEWCLKVIQTLDSCVVNFTST
jgi:hypothetical protein